jgi:uncharacterized protein YgiM (DUF1202 family)
VVPAPAPTPDILKRNSQDFISSKSQRKKVSAGRIIGEGAKNIRTGPGTKYTVKAQVMPGESVKVLGSSSGSGGYSWIRIRTAKGDEGWIAAHLIAIQ